MRSFYSPVSISAPFYEYLKLLSYTERKEIETRMRDPGFELRTSSTKGQLFSGFHCVYDAGGYQARKIVPGGRVTLPVTFCLETWAIFDPPARVTLPACKQGLSREEERRLCQPPRP